MLKKYGRIVAIFLTAFLLFTVPAFAEQPHVSTSTEGEPVVYSPDNMASIGSMSAQGVSASAYITALDATSDPAFTHLVGVTFSNEKTGVALQKGLAGVKFRRLYGEASEPIWMEMQEQKPGFFVSRMTLKKKGTYLFIVGSKLEDNRKRQFTFQHSYR